MSDLLGFRGTPPLPDLLARQAVADRASRVLRPTGSLSRFDEVAAWLAGWQRTDTPSVERPVLLMASGDHGVVRRGVTSYPSKVTRAMVDAFRAGVASSSIMAREARVDVRLVDAGVGEPTGDITVEPALDVSRFREMIELGRDTVDELDCDVLLLGEMGIGNSTAAASVAGALVGGPSAEWVGPGAGADDDVIERKRHAVARAVERVHGAEPAEVLRQVGGGELAVLAGACLRARERSIPVVIDGFVVTAAVAAVASANSGGVDHCMAATLSPEPGHARLLDHLGLRPFLDLEMRLGEAAGALVALPLVRMAARLVVDVPTFEEWGLG